MADSGGQVQRRAEKASPNVYTVLALIAFIVLAGGIVYLVMRAQELQYPLMEVIESSLDQTRTLLASLL